MMRKKLIFVIIILVIVLAGVWFNALNEKDNSQVNEPRATSHEPRYYTCGMHPTVKISPEEYNKGSVNCPICNMKLTPVHKEEKNKAQEESSYYGCGMQGTEHVFFIKDGELETCPICGMPLKQLSKEEADNLKGVVSRVQIAGRQASLAGVKTETVKKLHLYKEIRTVGKVAYDPELAIAQEEFISGLKAFDKIKQGQIPEIKERALNLIESARRKLRLLGLSQEQIQNLEEEQQVEISLILPEQKMWIYGDVYEYELSWVDAGEKVTVIASGLPGEEFKGVISSLNPVVDPKTRSVRFRAEVENPQLKLKPQMYVDVIIQSMYKSKTGEHMVPAIAKDAVLDTGTRKIVWLDKGEGLYEGRIVSVGPEAVATIDGRESKFYPILKGLNEGEVVVTKANFLIDSQSQISGVASSAYGGALDAQEQPAAPIHQH